ncbi:MAG TPA: succinate dehydrogenase assembly factor 4 [Steroidobacteraceae bacterium]
MPVSTTAPPAPAKFTANDAGLGQTGCAPSTQPAPRAAAVRPPLPEEIGGPQGPEPTRFGDWEKLGRCIDF